MPALEMQARSILGLAVEHRRKKNRSRHRLLAKHQSSAKKRKKRVVVDGVFLAGCMAASTLSTETAAFLSEADSWIALADGLH
mmetsp:Transcript_134544/g.335718  ORF Transcript_134544/g.335718 Transcript_134544/m.335718 type:complete len:83 (-) Transcript_134544:95-343(-)